MCIGAALTWTPSLIVRTRCRGTQHVQRLGRGVRFAFVLSVGLGFGFRVLYLVLIPCCISRGSDFVCCVSSGSFPALSDLGLQFYLNTIYLKTALTPPREKVGNLEV
jgi:hypothetical protein